MRFAVSWFAALAAAFAFTGCGEETPSSSDAQVEKTVQPAVDVTERTANTADVAPDEVEGAADDKPEKSSARDPKAIDYNEVISPYLSELLADPSTAHSSAASAALRDLADSEGDAECRRAAEDTAKEISDETGTPASRRSRISEASGLLQLC